MAHKGGLVGAARAAERSLNGPCNALPLLHHADPPLARQLSHAPFNRISHNQSANRQT